MIYLVFIFFSFFFLFFLVQSFYGVGGQFVLIGEVQTDHLRILMKVSQLFYEKGFLNTKTSQQWQKGWGFLRNCEFSDSDIYLLFATIMQRSWDERKRKEMRQILLFYSTVCLLLFFFFWFHMVSNLVSQKPIMKTSFWCMNVNQSKVNRSSDKGWKSPVSVPICKKKEWMKLFFKKST